MKDSEDTLGQIALTFGTMKSSKAPIPPLPRGEGEREGNRGSVRKGLWLDWKHTTSIISGLAQHEERLFDKQLHRWIVACIHSDSWWGGKGCGALHGRTSEGQGGGGSGDEGGKKERISTARDIEIVSQSFTGQIPLSPSCFLGKIYESSQTEATDKAALFFFFFLGKEIEPEWITV